MPEPVKTDLRDVMVKSFIAAAENGVPIMVVVSDSTSTAKIAPFQEKFPDRIVNTHPALLPAFKGWHAVRDSLAAGVKITGCTVHLATLEVDEGPILAQEAVPVLPSDTEESLHERIKEVERRIYPQVLRAILDAPDGGTA